MAQISVEFKIIFFLIVRYKCYYTSPVALQVLACDFTGRWAASPGEGGGRGKGDGGWKKKNKRTTPIFFLFLFFLPPKKRKKPPTLTETSTSQISKLYIRSN